MARQAHPGLLEIAAWPVDVLRAQPTGPIRGFVMPKVSGYQEIHSLYGPAHRKRAFPQADWSFLIHAARNPVSYTHLDVYKRQLSPGAKVAATARLRFCLLYTSRCV